MKEPPGRNKDRSPVWGPYFVTRLNPGEIMEILEKMEDQRKAGQKLSTKILYDVFSAEYFMKGHHL